MDIGLASLSPWDVEVIGGHLDAPHRLCHTPSLHLLLDPTIGTKYGNQLHHLDGVKAAHTWVTSDFQRVKGKYSMSSEVLNS
jgi:hypothetical protein